MITRKHQYLKEHLLLVREKVAQMVSQFTLAQLIKKLLGTSATDGIAVYFDEYNSDQVKVYKNGSLVDIEFYSTYVLDDYRWRNYTVIYEYVDANNAFVNVYIENVFVCRDECWQLGKRWRLWFLCRREWLVRRLSTIII
jgi:hypothetical protein